MSGKPATAACAADSLGPVLLPQLQLAVRRGLHHFAYLRALAEGLSVEDATARYLHVHHARSARRAVVKHVRRPITDAIRRGGSLARDRRTVVAPAGSCRDYNSDEAEDPGHRGGDGVSADGNFTSAAFRRFSSLIQSCRIWFFSPSVTLRPRLSE